MSKLPKFRADQLLVVRGLAESRTRAQALILAGTVFSGETKLVKAGQTLPADAPLEVRGRDHPWRSEERRVGKECIPPCRSRWSPYH